MSRFKGFLVFVVGLVFLILGLGMWRSPEMDWPGFIQEWRIVIGEIGRLVNDPFALIGILVFAVGGYLTIRGLVRLVKG
jgi:hypothetical protein